MNIETIREWMQRTLFIPFGLRLSNGEEHEVRHPENIALGKNRLTVVDPDIGRVVHLSLIHGNSIKALQTARIKTTQLPHTTSSRTGRWSSSRYCGRPVKSGKASRGSTPST